MGKTKDADRWIATAILVITISAMFAIILNFVRIGFFVGPFRLNHWFVWIGTIYIAFAVPVIARIKSDALNSTDFWLKPISSETCWLSC